MRSFGVAAALDAGVVGALETADADTDGADASRAEADGTGSLGLAVEVAFEPGASPVAEGGPGVEQAARSASGRAARSMPGAYHLGAAQRRPGGFDVRSHVRSAGLSPSKSMLRARRVAAVEKPQLPFGCVSASTARRLPSSSPNTDRGAGAPVTEWGGAVVRRGVVHVHVGQEAGGG
jgi:hypothetical protein